jgi:putative phosphoribosyl transferase
VAKTLYTDRGDAAKALADSLKLDLEDKLPTGKPLVLAIPRGGVVLGRDVARMLGADLDLIVPRKLGAEGNPEFAIGAVMQDGTQYLNQDAIRATGAGAGYIEGETQSQLKEAKRRLDAYRGGREEPQISGRAVIVVDDGVATGATMIVALRWVRSRGARLVVAATPVAPPSALALLRQEADYLVCPHSPEPFYAIGAFYEKFEQVSDRDVKELLEGFWRGPPSPR